MSASTPTQSVFSIGYDFHLANYMSPGIVAESDLNGVLQSEYVFFGGERVARKDFPSNAVAYYFSDHLKTADIITDAQGNITKESDFYPWGGELQFVNNDSNRYRFTGKERDVETGLDYFGARYYSNGLGRWVSADWSSKPVPVPYAELPDPQTLNLYGYVRNTPETMWDNDGHARFGRDGELTKEQLARAQNADTKTQVVAAGMVLALPVALVSSEVAAGSVLVRSLIGMGMYYGSTPAGQNLINGTAEAISNPLPTAGPSAVVRAESEAAHIALGYNEGLRNFARQVGATHLLDHPSWKQAFRRAVADKATKFSVKLDGMPGATAEEQIMGMIESVGKGEGGHTAWELKELMNAGRLKDLKLYQDGKLVLNPFR
jgi:RHS repeat-associated protein